MPAASATISFFKVKNDNAVIGTKAQEIPMPKRILGKITAAMEASLFKDENIKTEYDKIKKPITVNKRFSTYLATSPKTKSPIKQAIALGKTVSPAREGE